MDLMVNLCKQQSILFMVKLRMRRMYKMARYDILGSVSTQPIIAWMAMGRIISFRVSISSSVNLED